MNEDEPDSPPGVTLTDWSNFPARRQSIFDEVKKATDESFPQVYGNVRLELHNTHYDSQEPFTKREYKDALMQDKFLHRRLRGTWKLFDNTDNSLLDSREATIMKVPYLTDSGIFIHNGSQISTISQARLQPGVYNRKKSSGELESHFNLKRGTGSSFRVELEPQSGIFRIKVGQASLKLYPLLSALGVSDADLEKKWGKELMEKNRAASDSRVLAKAHMRLVRRADPNKSEAEKIEEIRSALNAGLVSREVVSRTLPNLKESNDEKEKGKP